jgi:DNA invertase Pin-like site-specific DNA recombinase
MKYGYVRVSTDKQDLALQLDAMERMGIPNDCVFSDVISSKKTSREGLDGVLARLQPGDTLYVWKLDRLGRTVSHLAALVDDLREKGIGFVSITEGFDITTTMGKAMMGMMAVFAEMERNQISERTKAGLKATKARGQKLGRPFTIPEIIRHNIREMLSSGMTVREVARSTGVSKSQVALIGEPKN